MKVKCTPVFEKNYQATGKIVINRGGTRSSKTVSLCQQVGMWLATGQFRENLELKNGTVRIVRKHATTIKNSVQVDWEEVLDSMELWDDIEHNKVDKTYTLKDGKNRRTVVFSGADDQQKLRGMKQDILYCNEANELHYKQEFFQLLMRTKHLTVIDFNPDDEDIWINVDLEKQRAKDKGDVEVIVSTFKDNPLLPKQMIEEIEYLETTDPAYWQIYGLGQYGKIKGLVFPDWGESPSVRQEAKFLGYGLDFGYTNDPTTLVKLWHLTADGLNDLYAEELLYETGLTNNEIADKFDALGLDKSDEIFADSAEPKSIQELCDRGYNVKPAKKGKDSIVYGIEIIKQHRLMVVGDSYNLKKELKHYKWLEDKEGHALNKPIDKFNHLIDAIRYCATASVQHRQPVSLAAKKNAIARMRSKMINQGHRL